MRLICPNCGAQYEVPDDVIPPEGRDVQCSSCGNTWFQEHADQAHDVEEAIVIPDQDWVDADEPSQEVAEPEAEVSEATPAEDTTDSTTPIANEEMEDAFLDDEVEDDFDADQNTQGRIISMAAEATDEALTAAVKEAVRRTLPEAVAEEETEEEPELESELNAWLDSDTPEQAGDQPDETTTEQVDEETTSDDVADDAPRRRELDPAVTEVLREEAELETSLRAEETAPIETQADLGLDEPLDDAAQRALQSRERMARLRGKSVEEVDNPPPPPPSNSRRDLLPDIEEINSTLRSTEDRPPEELPDGRPTLTQRRAGGSRIGFALAILLIAGAAYVYSKPESVTNALPTAEPAVTSFVQTVDSGRLALDRQMTKLMVWLDGIASGGDAASGAEDAQTGS